MGEITIAAIELAYRQRYARFLRVALALLGDEDRARDAVQEAFARAIQQRFSHRGEGAVDTWVWRMLVNVCIDETRRRTPAPADAVEGASTNGHAGEWAEVRAAVAALPERQRLVLFLRHYADLDYEAIAAALAIERGTVAATLHAAHNAMRRTITEVAS